MCALNAAVVHRISTTSKILVIDGIVDALHGVLRVKFILEILAETRIMHI